VDAGEGIAKTKAGPIDYGSMTQSEKERTSELLRTAGIDIDASIKGLDIKIGGMDITSKPANPFVFCVSLDPYEEVKKAMCEDAPEGWKYDACVEICDAKLFIDAIHLTGHIDKQPLKEMCDIHFGPIKYAGRETNLLKEPMKSAIFRKPENFAAQQEGRFWFDFYEHIKLEAEHQIISFEPPPFLLKQKPV